MNTITKRLTHWCLIQKAAQKHKITKERAKEILSYEDYADLCDEVVDFVKTIKLRKKRLSGQEFRDYVGPALKKKTDEIFEKTLN